MPLFVAKSRSSLTSLHIRTVPLSNQIEYRAGEPVQSSTRKDTTKEEVDLYNPYDSDPFKYQPRSSEISPEDYVDLSSSFESYSDASFDEFSIVPPPLDSLDYSLISVTQAIGKSSYVQGYKETFARTMAPLVGGMVEKNEQKSLAVIDSGSDNEIRALGRVNVLGLDSSERSVSNMVTISETHLCGPRPFQRYVAREPRAFHKFPSPNFHSKGHASIKKDTLTNPLGISIPDGNSCLMASESLVGSSIRPSKIPRYVCAPLQHDRKTSPTFQRAEVPVRCFRDSLASSTCTTVSIGSTESLPGSVEGTRIIPRSERVALESRKKGSPIVDCPKSRFSTATHDSIPKKSSMKWYEPTFSKLKKITSWRQGNLLEESRNLSYKSPLMKRQLSLPNSRGSPERAFYSGDTIDTLNTPAVAFTVRTLSLPTFSTRWSTDWETVLAGIKYKADQEFKDKNNAPPNHSETLALDPIATAFKVTISPHQCAQRVQTRIRTPSITLSAEKASRRNGGIFDISVASMHIPLDERPPALIHKQITPVVEEEFQPAYTLALPDAHGIPVTPDWPSNHRVNRISSRCSRIPRYFVHKPQRNSMNSEASSASDSTTPQSNTLLQLMELFPEPPSHRCGIRIRY